MEKFYFNSLKENNIEPCCKATFYTFNKSSCIILPVFKFVRFK